MWSVGLWHAQLKHDSARLFASATRPMQYAIAEAPFLRMTLETLCAPCSQRNLSGDTNVSSDRLGGRHTSGYRTPRLRRGDGCRPAIAPRNMCLGSLEPCWGPKARGSHAFVQDGLPQRKIPSPQATTHIPATSPVPYPNSNVRQEQSGRHGAQSKSTPSQQAARELSKRARHVASK